MEQRTFTLGPWGGSGGDGWDDGYHTGVREIHLSVGDQYILSITVFYDKQRRLFKAAKHGEGNSSIKGKTEKVSLIVSSNLLFFFFSFFIFLDMERGHHQPSLACGEPHSSLFPSLPTLSPNSFPLLSYSFLFALRRTTNLPLH